MTLRALTAGGFVVLAAALVTLDLLGRRSVLPVPTVGDVFSRLMSRPAGRVGVWLGWWWLGWHFFVR